MFSPNVLLLSSRRINTDKTRFFLLPSVSFSLISLSVTLLLVDPWLLCCVCRGGCELLCARWWCRVVEVDGWVDDAFVAGPGVSMDECRSPCGREEEMDETINCSLSAIWP